MSFIPSPKIVRSGNIHACDYFIKFANNQLDILEGQMALAPGVEQSVRRVSPLTGVHVECISRFGRKEIRINVAQPIGQIEKPTIEVKKRPEIIKKIEELEWLVFLAGDGISKLITMVYTDGTYNLSFKDLDPGVLKCESWQHFSQVRYSQGTGENFTVASLIKRSTPKYSDGVEYINHDQRFEIIGEKNFPSIGCTDGHAAINFSTRNVYTANFLVDEVSYAKLKIESGEWVNDISGSFAVESPLITIDSLVSTDGKIGTFRDSTEEGTGREGCETAGVVGWRRGWTDLSGTMSNYTASGEVYELGFPYYAFYDINAEEFIEGYNTHGEITTDYNQTRVSDYEFIENESSGPFAMNFMLKYDYSADSSLLNGYSHKRGGRSIILLENLSLVIGDTVIEPLDIDYYITDYYSDGRDQYQTDNISYTPYGKTFVHAGVVYRRFSYTDYYWDRFIATIPDSGDWPTDISWSYECIPIEFDNDFPIVPSVGADPTSTGTGPILTTYPPQITIYYPFQITGVYDVLKSFISHDQASNITFCGVEYSTVENLNTPGTETKHWKITVSTPEHQDVDITEQIQAELGDTAFFDSLDCIYFYSYKDEETTEEEIENADA